MTCHYNCQALVVFRRAVSWQSGHDVIEGNHVVLKSLRLLALHAEYDPNKGPPTLPGVSLGAPQQYDPWAGQHVPSQGFSPHPSPLFPSHGANPLNPPGYSSGQVPAAPAAASSFPTTMSSPFAQACYPPQSDPWAFEPEPSSSLLPAQPGYPPSVPAQPVNLWAPVATYPGANPWDPSAAASSPWDSGMAGQAPAGLGGEYGGQDSEYRSPDGRPAVPLMVFGFAGKMYCWRPATSTSSSGQSVSQSVREFT